MKQRENTPYNFQKKKIVPARKMVGKIARVKIKMVISLVILSFYLTRKSRYFIDIYIIMTHIKFRIVRL